VVTAVAEPVAKPTPSRPPKGIAMDVNEMLIPRQVKLAAARKRASKKTAAGITLNVDQMF